MLFFSHTYPPPPISEFSQFCSRFFPTALDGLARDNVGHHKSQDEWRDMFHSTAGTRRISITTSRHDSASIFPRISRCTESNAVHVSAFLHATRSWNGIPASCAGQSHCHHSSHGGFGKTRLSGLFDRLVKIYQETEGCEGKNRSG